MPKKTYGLPFIKKIKNLDLQLAYCNIIRYQIPSHTKKRRNVKALLIKINVKSHKLSIQNN